MTRKTNEAGDVWCESCQEYHPADEVDDGDPVAPLAVAEASHTEGYPTKEDMLKSLRAGIPALVKAGRVPHGTTIDDIKIDSVVFKMTLPDGSTKVMGASLRPEEFLQRRAARVAGTKTVN